MRQGCRRWMMVGALAATLGGLRPGPAGALLRVGPAEFSGNLQAQQLIRHPDADTFQFIQQRNTLRLRLDYEWLQAGKFYSRYDVPFLESSKLFVLYRGVYDSVYSYKPGFIEKNDLHGRAYGGQTLYEFANAKGNASVQNTLLAADQAEARGDTLQAAQLRRQAGRQKNFARRTLTLNSLSNDESNAIAFENALREMYVDLRFRDLPLTIRAGRQQIVWGESDNFRMLDRVNPLDVSWHLVQEIPPPAFGWDDLRRPFWMFKFLYELGDVWKLSQSFVEWYWNPGDWSPLKVSFLPRPWGVKLLDPLRNPVDGGFIGGLCQLSKFKAQKGVNRGLGYCTTLMDNTVLFDKGDYDRNAIENSQVGIRYHGITPQGIEFTLNYIHQRWAGDDGSSSAPIRGLLNTRDNRALAQRLLTAGIFPAQYYAPYVNTVGVAGNYSDETLTQAVFRVETVYDFGIPFFDVARETTLDNPALPGITKKDMWKGMIGVDRPTWVRWLNKKSTVFLSSQVFFHHMIDNTDCEPQIVANFGTKDKKRVGSCLVGNLDLPSTVRNNSPGNPAFRDKIRDWEALATLGAFTFYRGGSVIPFAGIAIDPVNHWGMEAFWMLDYYLTPNMAVNVAQRYFITPAGTSQPVFDPWGIQSLSSGRSETSIRLSYNF